MNRAGIVAAGVGAAAVVLSACGSYGSGGAGGSASTGSYPGSYSSGAAPAAGSSSTVVDLRSTTLGQILVDGSGRTLYLFEGDKGMSSTCDGACAGVWPPLVSSGGGAQAGQGVNQSLLGTTTRTDGTKEVTYNGHPLYHFASDQKAGDTTGQGLTSFGANWYVLAASGDKVDHS